MELQPMSGGLLAIFFGRLGMSCEEAWDAYERLGRCIFVEEEGDGPDLSGERPSSGGSCRSCIFPAGGRPERSNRRAHRTNRSLSHPCAAQSRPAIRGVADLCSRSLFSFFPRPGGGSVAAAIAHAHALPGVADAALRVVEARSLGTFDRQPSPVGRRSSPKRARANRARRPFRGERQGLRSLRRSSRGRFP